MTQPKTPVPSEKDRRAAALQKALRDNLRRRKAAATNDETPAEQNPENPPADAGR